MRFDDAPLLVDIFEHMTAQSRYRRFRQITDQVNPSRVRQEAINIAQADISNNWGLIAFADLPNRQNVPIGAVRFVRTTPYEAEVAISIRDDFQNVGIGTQLMHMLAKAAHKMGLQRLVAEIQNDNPAIWYVFKSLPYHVDRLPEGVFSNIVISLNLPRDMAGSISTG
jgi:acetyltransferase